MGEGKGDGLTYFCMPNVLLSSSTCRVLSYLHMHHGASTPSIYRRRARSCVSHAAGPARWPRRAVHYGPPRAKINRILMESAVEPVGAMRLTETASMLVLTMVQIASMIVGIVLRHCYAYIESRNLP